jgi:hypothetical protein
LSNGPGSGPGTGRRVDVRAAEAAIEGRAGWPRSPCGNGLVSRRSRRRHDGGEGREAATGRSARARAGVRSWIAESVSDGNKRRSGTVGRTADCECTLRLDRALVDGRCAGVSRLSARAPTKLPSARHRSSSLRESDPNPVGSTLTKTPSFPRKREPKVASIRALAPGRRFRGGDDKVLGLLAAFQVGF